MIAIFLIIWLLGGLLALAFCGAAARGDDQLDLTLPFS
jgi:hypothetical protein